MPAPSTETTETNEPSRVKRRFVWTLVVVCVLLLLVLTPPLLNVNRLQRRIAASMSASLGRTVQMDRVALHVLPVPGFTLQNLTVSEDPGFGSEPVIRANTVEVTLRPSSLWRRQVEVSSIKFIDPSLNLVRNARGEWNVQSLLMHAASVSTAPTAQLKAGPEPRFPYVEATGARVNLKLGEEKEPFSLTEADFALWLPSPQQWRVRLEGKPERTDTNISDPGTIRLEGTLQRAGTMAEVPVDLTGSWEGAPLGEASKLLTGEDKGWRGNLTVSAALTGKLSAAKLSTKIHLTELRRTDFIPVLSMDVRAECGGTLDVTTAVVSETDCSVDAPLAEGEKVQGRVVAMVDRLDLSELTARGLHVGMTNLSNAWLLDWVRLFSQRVPAGERPGGTVAGSIQAADVRAGAEALWLGEIHGDVLGAMPWKPVEKDFVEHPVSISSRASSDGKTTEFVLAPVSLTPPGKTPGLVLSGTATDGGYTLRLTGSATEEQMAALRGVLPPLADGLQVAVPAVEGEAVGAGSEGRAIKVDVTCSRAWGWGQTCEASKPAVPQRRRKRR